MALDRRFHGVGWGFAPFAGAAVLAWVAVTVGSSIDWSQYAASVGLLAFSGALAMGRLSGRRARWLGIVPNSLLFLAAVALLRNSAGGINSSAAGLALIPVFHTALYSRSRRELQLVLAGVAVFYVAPIVIFGPPGYPDSQYRAALLSVLVSSIIGLATQRLVADVRHQAGEARSREQMLEQVAAVVRGLRGRSQARTDVCEATRTISDASVAVLYEPVPETGALRATAMAGIAAPAADVPADQPSALRDAFAAGTAILIPENPAGRRSNTDVWVAAARPQSVLYQPLLRGGNPLGVLAVGWPMDVTVDGPRATVIALLAHEAAAVIDQADALEQLTDMAQTDPLTGLPNRRAWDAHVKQAMADQRQFTIAMLDLDHFKLFNDTHGHPAGDRLLKETSAAWRTQLRPGDLLARLGGEEFGLLLLDTDRETATSVSQRLLEHVSLDQTCSAGIAIRVLDEGSESVIARADRALYEAKRLGRDRAHVGA